MNQKQGHETGYCAVCGSDSSFRFDSTIITPQLQKAWGISDNLVEAFNRKESMFCSYCGASLRIRHLATVLMQTFLQISGTSCESVVELLRNKEFRQLKIAEINACGALHSYLKDHPNLYYSEWLPDGKPGEVHDGVRCEDLQCLTYPDNYFDIILTSETLEYVPESDRAWREINRTLKSGGYHVFTIPVIPSQRQTIQRARLVEGVRKDLLEPAYHGTPERQNMIVYTDFGMDVTDKLDDLGLRTEVFYLNPEADLHVAMVFRSQKSDKPVTDAAKKVFPGLEWTGDRYVPWLEEAAIGYEHLHRYAYATQFVHNKTVLDLACGEGYGSYLLARTAESVVSIDIDENAIKHARNKYIKQNLEFKVGSITEVSIAGSHVFDVAVCFEALEHIKNHHKLLTEVKRLLTPDGVFIVSTPNKTVYSDEPQFNNPFHVHELYFDEFRGLFEKYFKNVKYLGQRIYCNSNIWPVFPGADSKVVEYVIDRNPREFVFVENEKHMPLYFMAIATDADCVIEQRSSVLVDVSDALLQRKDRQIASHAREQERLGQEAARFSETIQAQQQALEEKENQLAQITTERKRLTGEIAQLQSTARSQQETLTQLQSTARSQQEVLAEKEKEVKLLVAERERLGEESSQLQANLQTREQYIRAIEDSLAWMLVVRYKKIREKLFPPGTRRQKIYSSVKDYCKKLAQGRAAASLLNDADPFGSKTNTQDISLPDEVDTLAPQISASRSILPRPEEAIWAKLSVLIPTRNGMSEGFESTLRAISRQIGIPEIELIVVDSGSSDGTVEAARNYGAKVFSIPSEEFNHGTTRNYAADQTMADLLVFTVQDAVPATDDLFYEMAKALLRDPKLAGVSVRQLPKSNADLYACWEKWNHNRFHLESPQEQILQLAGLDNVCSMVKRSIWEKIRFKPTQYAEDLQFGLSCLREGYRISWLSHRSTIHSHTRPPFYYMSRHYADRRVMFDLLKDPPAGWVETVTLDQLFSAVKATYFVINEFVRSIEASSMHDPRHVLRELVTFVSARRGLTHAPDGRRGEPSLSEFFEALEGCFKSDFPDINPCLQDYQGKIHSILEFLGDRYPRVSGLELIPITYKAYAAVAGSVFGSFYCRESQREFSSSQSKRLDDLLARGYRK
jgi:2-polyprenyl-3-methyl-5-hydroxy-6-metoxy-1,4-benzoquinol methylase/GT2 family glycosyltransferase/predicted  nucleic acid-binding Zn-ribbon protein